MHVETKTVFVITPVGGITLANEEGDLYEFPTEADAQEWLYHSGRSGEFHIDVLVIHRVPEKAAGAAKEIQLSSALKQIEQLTLLVNKLIGTQAAPPTKDPSKVKEVTVTSRKRVTPSSKLKITPDEKKDK